MTPKPIVYVVDDDPSVRRSLRRLMDSIGLTARLFGGAEEFLAGYDREQPGCLVLDVRMPGSSGLELQDELAARSIEVPIIFITGHADVPMSVRAMKAGAIEFLQKPFSEQALLDAVYNAIAKDAARRKEREAREDADGRVKDLTTRELEVLRLVIAGKPNKAIATELGISEATVKVHRGRVMEKTGVESVAELVVLAQRAGLTTTKV